MNSYLTSIRARVAAAFLALSLGVACNLVFAQAEKLSFEVLQTLPHDTTNFTQGLFFYNGDLYESTGKYGRSKLIRYRDDHYSVLMARAVPAKYFAEGATAHQDQIYQLTWHGEVALVYDPKRLSRSEGFTYEGQGWGLASDGEHLWMSDGSNLLEKIDVNGAVLESIAVTHNGSPLDRLNELEWIDGKIYANRWYDTKIYVIDPVTGDTTNYLDLSSLASPEIALSRDNILNGIAWEPESQTLWITGKNWQSLYQLKIQ